MKKFPEIRTIKDVEIIRNYENFSFLVDEKFLTTNVCYSYLFDNNMDDPIFLEARGIVFNKNGDLIARPFHKFFNMNQSEETLSSKLDFNEIEYIMEKMDGSMVYSVIAGNGVDYCIDGCNFNLKTKKVFRSNIQEKSIKIIKNNHSYLDLCNFFSKINKTVIFEFVSKDNKIIINYEKDDLYLLAIRDNLTGEYLNINELLSISSKYKIKIPKLFYNFRSFDEMLNFTKKYQLNNFEGFVIKFKNGNMIKLKTDKYCEIHKIVTEITNKNIVEACINNTIDDIKPFFYNDERILNIIKKRENEILEEFHNLKHYVEKIIEKEKELTIADFAKKYKDNERFFLLINGFKNKEIDYASYMRRAILPGYSSKKIIFDN